MALPEPHPGMVIRYVYLWRSQSDEGRDEGVKERPCAVVLAVKRSGGETKVVVAPITHAHPVAPNNAVEIPAQTKSRLGLDEARSWIITDEVNIFTWPGPDLRPIDTRYPRRGFVYGALSQRLTHAVVESVRSNVRKGSAKTVQRDEAVSK